MNYITSKIGDRIANRSQNDLATRFESRLPQTAASGSNGARTAARLGEERSRLD